MALRCFAVAVAAALVSMAAAQPPLELRNIAAPALDTVVVAAVPWDVGDPSYPAPTPTDSVFFAAAATAVCPTVLPSPSFQVSLSSGDPAVTILFSAANGFAAGSTYAVCYFNTGNSASYLLDGTVTVQAAVYSGFAIDAPAGTPPLAQAPIQATLTEVAVPGRQPNQWTPTGAVPFLLQCGNADAACAQFDATALLCPTASGIPMSRPTGTPQAVTFAAPLQSTAGYHVCVPYSSTKGTAWSVVRGAKVYFNAANPTRYTVVPATRRARVRATVTITGTGLSADDVLAVVSSTSSCEDNIAMPSMTVSNFQAVSAASATAELRYSAYVAPGATVQGKLCYLLNANKAAGGTQNVWSSVFLDPATATSATADYTVAALNPSAFTAVTATPRVGEPLQVTFQGSAALTAGTDAAFLVSTSSSSCTDETLCTTATPRYACTLTQGDATHTTCGVTIGGNLGPAGLSVCGCYKEAASPNHVLLPTLLAVQPRSPSAATMTPTAWYGGQQGTLVLTGDAFSAGDELKFLASGADCSTAAAASSDANVSFSRTAVTATQATYIVVALPQSCVTLCYRRGVGTFVETFVSGAQRDPSCPATSLYADELDITAAPSPAAVPFYTTAEVTLTVGASLSLPASTRVVLVEATEACTTRLCGAPLAGACEASNVSAFTSSMSLSGTQTSPLHVALAAVSGAAARLLLCVSLGGDPYAPIRLATAAAYTFATAARNPTSQAPVPAYRRALTPVLLDVAGSGLAAAGNELRLYNVAELSDGTVCPPESASTPSVIPLGTEQWPGTPPTNVLARYNIKGQAGAAIAAVANVAVCVYHTVGGSTVASLAGIFPVGAQLPATYTAPSGLRALQPATITFGPGSAGVLSASADAVVFYEESCFCDSTCAGSPYALSGETLTAAASPAGGVVWATTRGFGNIARAGTFTVCYRPASLAPALPAAHQPATYLGTFAVGVAHPTYFEAVGAPRVGALLRILVGTLCDVGDADCPDFSAANDDLVLVPEAQQCGAAATDAALFQTMTALTVEVATPRQAERRFVALATGTYRVCYRVGTAGTFREVGQRFTTGSGTVYNLTLLTVGGADPASFEATVAAPAATEELVLNLTCGAATSTDSGCRCDGLQLVPGAQGNCWDASALSAEARKLFTSRCDTGTLVFFTEIDLAAGEYTVCYGAPGLDAVRIPGTVTVGAANPASYAHALGATIFTNQANDVVLQVTGTGLSAAGDKMVVAPTSQHCHLSDASSAPWNNNSHEVAWAPDVEPQGPKTVTSGGARLDWTLTSGNRRFSDVMLTQYYCDPATASCELKLCYRRAGHNWATVRFDNAASVLTLKGANPVKLTVDFPSKPRVGQYFVATVTGTGLQSTDSLTLTAGATGTCTGAVVADKGTAALATVSGGQTQWQSLLRFTAGGSTYTACYTVGSVVTMIPDIPALSTFRDEYSFVVPLLNATRTDLVPGYAMTQLEHLDAYFALSNPSLPITGLLSVVLVQNSSHCPFTGFNAPAAGSAVTLAVNTATNGATGILYCPAATYALCLTRRADGADRVYWVSLDPTAGGARGLEVAPMNPNAFDGVPTNPMVLQPAAVTFRSPAALPRLRGMDEVVAIVGTYADCGTKAETAEATGIARTALTTMNATADADPALSREQTLLPTAAVGTGEQPFTLCYRKYGGTFAPVPVASQYVTTTAAGPSTIAAGSLPPLADTDENWNVVPAVLLRWAAAPAHASVNLGLELSFHRRTDATLTLAAADGAALSLVPTGRTAPLPTDCLPNQTFTASTATVTFSSVDLTRWTIAANTLQHGNYTVCYRVAAQGGPADARVYIASPGLLEVFPPASPYDIDTGLVPADTGLPATTLYAREAVQLRFITAEPLSMKILGDPAIDAATDDVAALSASSTCSNPRGIGGGGPVTLVPTAFGYDAPTVAPGEILAFIHLRFDTAGTWFVCVKRAGRTAGQPFFDWSVVGTAASPKSVTVRAAAISSLTTTPAVLRALVPGNTGTVALSADVAAGGASQFAALFVGATTNPADGSSDVIAVDPCYRPTAAQSTATPAAVKLDTSLAWAAVPATSTTAVAAAAPFPDAGNYALCYQQPSRPVASLMPPKAVKVPAPIEYAVPAGLRVGATFVMTFYSNDTDNVLASTSNAIAVRDDAVADGCTGTAGNATALASGTSVVSALTSINATHASMSLRILQQGSFRVCFRVFDQAALRAVPRDVGGLLFAIGDAGPKSYTVAPAPAYHGQTLTLTVGGVDLVVGDKAKLIDAGSASDAAIPALCTAAAEDITASGTVDGRDVAVASSTEVSFTVRVNVTVAKAVLCYRPVAAGAWLAVPTSGAVSAPWSVPIFAPHPTGFGVNGAHRVVFGNQRAVLSFTELASSGAPDHALSNTDEVMLAAETAAADADGFLCYAGQTATNAVAAPARAVSPTPATSQVFSMCTPVAATTAAMLEVCYRLSAGTWATAPFVAAPSFAARLQVVPRPFTAAAVSRATPRLYDVLDISFTPAIAGDTVTRLRFTAAVATPCTAAYPAVVDTMYDGVVSSNVLRTAFPAAGAYFMTVWMASTGPDHNVTTSERITVSSCDPCSMDPLFAFPDSAPTLTVSGNTALAVGDTLRLVPRSSGQQPDGATSPCAGAAAWGGAAEWTGAAGGASWVRFAAAIPAKAPGVTVVGEYWACYRRSGDGAASAFSLLPPGYSVFTVAEPSPDGAVLCPNPTPLGSSALRLAGLNVTVAFQARAGYATTAAYRLDNTTDTAKLVQGSTAAACSLAGTAALPLAAAADGGSATFGVHFPHSATDISYVLCYAHRWDTKPRLVRSLLIAASDPSAVAVSPAEPTVGMTGIVLTVTGTDLRAADTAVVVDEATECGEACDPSSMTPTGATPAAIAPYTTATPSGTVRTLTFTAPFAAPQRLKVCYRRSGSTMAAVPNIIAIAGANPIRWETNTTLLTGTTVFLTFTGRGAFAAGDVATIRAKGGDCSAALHATGTFLSTAASTPGTTEDATSLFSFSLAGVPAEEYTVCYDRTAVRGFVVAVAPVPLTVLADVGLSWRTSNTPIERRPTVLTYPEHAIGTAPFGADDEGKIVGPCPGAACSCTTAPPVCPTASNGRTQCSVTVTVAAPAASMRFMLPRGEYLVCFRLKSSGWFQVKDPLTVLPAVPTVTTVPAPGAVYQGQRLIAQFASNSTAGDTLFVVTAARGCEDTPAMVAGGIVSQAPAVASPEPAIATTATGHFPSIGPNAALFAYPLDVVLCLREQGQDELLHLEHTAVALPSAIRALPASPSAATTAPAPLRRGHINVTATFGAIVAGSASDTAFAVAVPNGVDVTRACDRSDRTALSAVQSDPATSGLVLTPETESASVILCYTRAGGTVAEVVVLALAARAPSSYAITNSASLTPRYRHYAEYAFAGMDGDMSASVEVAFSEVPCAERSPVTTVAARQQRVAANTTHYTAMAQLREQLTTPADAAYVCAFAHGGWSQVAPVLALAAAQPSTFTVAPAAPRAGQQVVITLAAPQPAGGLTSVSPLEGLGWCSNETLTAAAPPMVVGGAAATSAMWPAPGNFTVCTGSAAEPPADAAATAWAESSLTVRPAHPSAVSFFSVEPRVGQRITATFVREATGTFAASDDVKLVALGQGCEAAAVVPHSLASVVVASGGGTSSATFADPAVDTVAGKPYASFGAAAQYTACYRSTTEGVWTAAGGTATTSLLTVKERAPSSFRFQGVDQFATLRRPFVMEITDATGDDALDANSNRAWTVPLTETCATTPDDAACVGCAWIPLDNNTAVSTAARVTTASMSLQKLGRYRVCYELARATAAYVPGVLVVEAGDVQCALNSTFTAGRPTELYLRKRDAGVVTTGDGLRIARRDATAADACSVALLEETFPMGRARQTGAAGAAEALFSFEWPVGASESTHTLCYRHQGIMYPMCSCAQIDADSADCFVSVAAASPALFATTPFDAVYAGQYIDLAIGSVLSEAAVEEVRLRPLNADYPATYTECSAVADADLVTLTAPTALATSDIPTPLQSLAKAVATAWKAPGAPQSYAVCARLAGSVEYYRVPVAARTAAVAAVYAAAGFTEPLRQRNALVLRPPVALTALPDASSNLRVERQTLEVNLTHPALTAAPNDVITTAARVVFTTAAADCNETEMAALLADPSTGSRMDVVGTTTAAAPLPLPMVEAFTADRAATLTAAFVGNSGGAAVHACVRLAHSPRWFAATNTLVIGAAIVETCSVPLEAPTATLPPGMRARQYLNLTVDGAAFAAMARGTDEVAVVPVGSPCTAVETAAVHRSPVLTPTTSPASAAGTVNGIVRAPSAGQWRVCYRLVEAGGLWSPVCPGVRTWAEPFPSEATSGECRTARQSLSVAFARMTTEQRAFDADDRLRIIPGAQPCALPAGAVEAAPGAFVQGLGATTTPEVHDHPVVPTGASPAATGVVHRLVFTASGSYRLCYRNGNGTYSDVPILPVSGSGAATDLLSLAAATPASVAATPTTPQPGQRISVFVAGTTAAQLITLPPVVDVTAVDPPAADATVDATGGALTADVYGNGAAYAGVGACSVSPPTTALSVSAAARPYPNGSTALVVPVAAASTLAFCYRPVGCGWADAAPIALLPPTVSGTSVFPGTPTGPRRGQLLQVWLLQNAAGPAMVAGADLGVFTDRTTCYDTAANTAGAQPLQTNASSARYFVAIAHARPAVDVNTLFRACYLRAAAGVWGAVASNTHIVLPANPTGFTTWPTQPTANQLIELSFAGAGLGPRDAVKVIALSRNCSDDAVPPETLVPLSASPSFAPMVATAAGWAVTSSAVDGRSATFNVTTTTPGRYSVCYRLEADPVWTLVYADLVVAPQQPASVDIFPVSALEGELFTMNFSARAAPAPSARATLRDQDLVRLVHGRSVQCLAAQSYGTTIQTQPSQLQDLPDYLAFQLAAGTRGDHTLCYVSRQIGQRDIVTWGFPVVKIEDNPTHFTLVPAVPRRGQTVAVTFHGHGLQSESLRSDEIALRPAGSLCAPADVANGDVAGIRRLGFAASGNTSTLWLVTDLAGPVVVCYKLFGGKYHRVSPFQLAFADPSPRIASTSRPLDNSALIYDGQRAFITLEYLGDGWRSGDYVFVAATGDCFSPGAQTQETLALDPGSGRMATSVRFRAPGTVALCYASGPTVTRLVAGVVVTPAFPSPVESSPVAVAALKVLRVALDVPGAATPATVGSFIFVASEAACVGASAMPSVRQVWLDVAYAAAVNTTTITVRAAFQASSSASPSTATPALCHFAPAASCGTDCARLLAVISVTAGADATLARTSVAVGDVVSATAALPAAAPSGWRPFLALAPVAAPDTAAAVAACAVGPADPSAVAGVITGDSVGVALLATFTLPEAGTYVPCISAAATPLEPHTFPGDLLTVAGSAATSASVQPTVPQAAAQFLITVAGTGLAAKDVCAVAPYPNGVVGGSCTGPGAVNATTTLPASTAGVLETSWAVTVPDSGEYVVCYRTDRGPASAAITPLPTASSPAVFTVSTVVWSVTLPSVPGGVVSGSPFTVAFSGVSLRPADRVAIAPAAGDCGAGGSATFQTVTAADGATASLTTSAAAGSYVVCYRPQYGATRVFGTPALEVRLRTVVQAAFSQLPVCMARTVCTTQPILQLRDNVGAAAEEPTAALAAIAVVGMTDAESTQLLTGAASHTPQTPRRGFTFYELGFRAPGTYQLTANVTMSGGTTLTATSVPFTVVANTGAALVTVACTPRLVRWEDAAESSCNVTRLSAAATPTFGPAVVNPGRASGLVAQPGGFEFLFSAGAVSPSAYPGASAAVTVAPPAGSIYAGAAAHTAATSLLYATYPTAASTLACAAAAADATLPAGAYVRVGADVRCALQPRAVTPGTTVPTDVVSYGADFTVATYVDEVPGAAAARSVAPQALVTIAGAQPPAEPTDATGALVWAFPSPRAAATLAVDAAAKGAPSGGARTEARMTGAPAVLTVIGVPTAASAMYCVIGSTPPAAPQGNATWPAQSTIIVAVATDVSCTLRASDAQGDVTAVGRDLTAGGSAGVTVTAPMPAATVGVYHSFTARPPTSTPSGDTTFDLTVANTRVGAAAIATTPARLLAATRISGPALVPGTTVVLTVEGSFLTASGVLWRVSRQQTCGSGNDVTVTGVTGTNAAQWSFVVPPGALTEALHACYSTDGGTTYTRLRSIQIDTVVPTPAPPPADSDTIDTWLIALIVGLVVLTLLCCVAAALLLLWFVRSRRQQYHTKSTTVFRSTVHDASTFDDVGPQELPARPNRLFTLSAQSVSPSNLAAQSQHHDPSGGVALSVPGSVAATPRTSHIPPVSMLPRAESNVVAERAATWQDQQPTPRGGPFGDVFPVALEEEGNGKRKKDKKEKKDKKKRSRNASVDPPEGLFEKPAKEAAELPPQRDDTYVFGGVSPGASQTAAAAGSELRPTQGASSSDSSVTPVMAPPLGADGAAGAGQHVQPSNPLLDEVASLRAAQGAPQGRLPPLQSAPMPLVAPDTAVQPTYGLQAGSAPAGFGGVFQPVTLTVQGNSTMTQAHK